MHVLHFWRLRSKVHFLVINVLEAVTFRVTLRTESADDVTRPFLGGKAVFWVGGQKGHFIYFGRVGNEKLDVFMS